MAIYDVNGNPIVADGGKTIHVPWQSQMHRGYRSSTVHENTLQAFHRAFLIGADWVEVDARLSSDNVYVVNHDATITVGGTTYTIASETAETLTALVLSTDETYGDCCLPTLESVLNLCLYTGMNASVDCKAINAATLAKLVVDSGMSGRVLYANTSVENATAILAVDPNAGFGFEYSSGNLATWANALSDYHVRRKSMAWSNSISYEAMENTRELGFLYLLANVSTTANMSFAPDVIEFSAYANCSALNKAYLDDLELL